MANKFDARQMIVRDTLARITGAANSEIDNIIRALDLEVSPPLALSVPGTGRVLNIGPITVVNPETGINKTIPPISSLLPTFASGTVTLGTTGAASATPSVGSALALGMTLSQFMRIGVNIDASGSLTLVKGTAASTLAAATIPPTVTGLFAIGHFVVRTDASNNVNNILDTDIYWYAGGGGNGGAGTGNTILETIKNELVDSPYRFVTPNIISTDAATKFATITGAAIDLVTSTIKYTADAQLATSVQQLDPQFLSKQLDVGAVDLVAFWNKGSSLQALSIPPASKTYTNLFATITNASTTVLVNTGTAHNLVTGAKVTTTTATAIGGISAANLSVTSGTITVIDDTTFTYTAAASATSSATGSLDTVAILGFDYEVSRDGGTNWFTVPMTRIGLTETFAGSLAFDKTATTEASKQVISVLNVGNATVLLDATSIQAISYPITLTATTKLQEVLINIVKVGSPIGTVTLAIVKDDGTGLTPSTSTNAILSASTPVAITGLSTGDITFDIPDVILTAGTYHIVISTDASYKSTFNSGTTNIGVRGRLSGASAPFEHTFNGTSWSAATSTSLYYSLNGRVLDLRLRIRSGGAPTYPTGLDGWGLFYDLQDTGLVGATKKTERFVLAPSDATVTFTLKTINPDPDLLTVYVLETGLTYKAPFFAINGNVVTFPTGSLVAAATRTLVFDQNSGGAFDNSDANVRLLAANHLGSTSSIDDKSSAGRGILIRRPDGTLREITIDNNDNISILSVP